MSNDDEHFTLVFKGNIRLLEGNPFKINTPYGLPVAVYAGDVLDEIEEMKAEVEEKS